LIIVIINNNYCYNSCWS